MTQRDDILIRLGLDSTMLQQGTAQVVTAEKKAAADYAAFWEAAIAKREAAEKASNIRIAEMQAATIRVNNEAAARGQEMWFKRQAIQSDIAAGSVPESMIAGAAGGAGVAGVGKAAEEAEAGLHGTARASREVAVIMREGLRGNFTRMIGSATILAGALGSIGAFITGLIAPVIVGTAAVLAPSAIGVYRANKAAQQNEQNVSDASERAGLDLIPKIVALQRSGQISGDEAADLIEKARSGKFEDVNEVLTKLHNAPGEKKNQDAQTDKEIQEKNKEYARENMTATEKVADDKKTIADLNAKIISGEFHGVNIEKERLAYADALIQLKRDEIELDKESADLAKTKAEKAKEQTDIQKQINSQVDDARRAQIGFIADQQRENEVFPTLQQLARFSGTMGRIGYRKIFQLTPQGTAARDILELQQDQLRSRISGNVDRADWDASRIGQLKSWLSASGFMPEDTKLDLLNDKMATVNTNIATLVAKANGDGLTVKVPAPISLIAD